MDLSLVFVVVDVDLVLFIVGNFVVVVLIVCLSFTIWILKSAELGNSVPYIPIDGVAVSIVASPCVHH